MRGVFGNGNACEHVRVPVLSQTVESMGPHDDQIRLSWNTLVGWYLDQGLSSTLLHSCVGKQGCLLVF